MMNTQYLTLILRLRLDDHHSQDSTGEMVYGSVQQAGLEEIRYFDSLKKLQGTVKQLVDAASRKEMNHGNSD